MNDAEFLDWVEEQCVLQHPDDCMETADANRLVKITYGVDWASTVRSWRTAERDVDIAREMAKKAVLKRLKS